MNYRYSTLNFLSKAHIISTQNGEFAPEWQDQHGRILCSMAIQDQ